jgi:hypothetical protein
MIGLVVKNIKSCKIFDKNSIFDKDIYDVKILQNIKSSYGEWW